MRFGRLGGQLIIGGVALLAIGYAFLVAASTIGNVVAGLGMGMIAIGSAAVSVSGPRPLHRRVMRIGLGALALGLAGLLVSSIIASTMTYDPLESWPVVIFGIGGFLFVALGLTLAIVSLLRAGGRSRLVGTLLAGGPALFVLAGTVAPLVSSGPFQVVTVALAVAGAVAFVLGGTGVGLMAMTDDRGAATVGD